MADTFQTGGTHAPGKNTEAADGTVLAIELLEVSPYGANHAKQVTLQNSSPMNSADVTYCDCSGS